MDHHHEKKWGGEWNGLVELFRSLPHITPGVAGWYLIIVKRVMTNTIWFLLALISTLCLLLDILRLVVTHWRSTTDEIKTRDYLDALMQGKVIWLAKFGGKKTLDWSVKKLAWLNDKIVRKIFTRPSEDKTFTTMTKSSLGFLVAWMLTCWCPWIGSQVALYFALVDPTAKLGHYSPQKYQAGREEGKSPFGTFCSYLAALGCIEIQVIYHFNYAPIFPEDISLSHGIAVFLAGAAIAPYLELKGGKWDNFWIPAMSAVTMMLVHGLLISIGY